MTSIMIIMLSIGSILAMGYVILLLVSAKKYDAYIQGLEDKEHLFKILYPIGFFLLEKINYQYKSKLDRKRLKECEVIFGQKYGEFYFRLNYAQKVSVGLLVIPFIFLVYSFMSDKIVFLFGIGLVGAAYWYYDTKITDIMKKRQEEIERDLPEVLSKLTLLVNAGMILLEAWENISRTGNTTFYIEMNQAMKDMHNGVPETEAILSFADRCMNSEVKKFASTLVQNVNKGNKELAEFLKKQTALSWEEKKHNVRRQGETASGKLLIPTGIMFAGILVLILVPMLANFSL